MPTHALLRTQLGESAQPSVGGVTIPERNGKDVPAQYHPGGVHPAETIARNNVCSGQN